MLREITDIYNKIKQLSRRIVKQIKYSLSNPIDDPACCEVLYINGTNGNIYYKDDNGDWILKTNSFDAIIDFSVNANPNTVGTTFSPNSPGLTTVLYVSTIDNNQWTYNGVSYVSYIAGLTSAAGVWIPAISGISNVSLIAINSEVFHYSRIGNQVTFSGSINIVPDAAASTEVSFSLPIASNFANVFDLIGVGTSSVTTFTGIRLEGDIATDTMRLKLTTTSTANGQVWFTGMYTII